MRTTEEDKLTEEDMLDLLRRLDSYDGEVIKDLCKTKTLVELKKILEEKAHKKFDLNVDGAEVKNLVEQLLNDNPDLKPIYDAVTEIANQVKNN